MSDDKTIYIMLQWPTIENDIIFESCGAKQKKHHFLRNIFLIAPEKAIFGTKEDIKPCKRIKKTLTVFLENNFNSLCQQNNGNVK